jgi:hypothetical protein
MQGSVMAGFPFLAIGIAFTALGWSGQKSFLAIGLAFVAIGLVLLARGRNARGAK